MTTTTTENEGINRHRLDWAEALRSPDFRQAGGALAAIVYDDNGDTIGWGNCCLGVACVLADVPLVDGEDFGTKGVNREHFDSDEWTQRHLPGTEVEMGHMPTWLRTLLGLERHQENTLAALNDDETHRFRDIAVLVELPNAYLGRALDSYDAAVHWSNRLQAGESPETIAATYMPY